MKIWELKKIYCLSVVLTLFKNKYKLFPTTLVFRDPKPAEQNCRLLQTASLWEILLFSDNERRGAEMFMARATFANEQKHQTFLFFYLFLDRPKILLFFSPPPLHTHAYSTVKKKVVSFVFKFFVWIIKRANLGYGDCLGTFKKKMQAFLTPVCLNNNVQHSWEKCNRLPKQI